MRILTNRYQDCELLNLGTNKNGRGPYVLRQDGIPPEAARNYLTHDQTKGDPVAI
jgi:hypothetical protein